MQELNVRLRLSADEIKLLEFIVRTKGFMGVNEYILNAIRKDLQTIPLDTKTKLLDNYVSDDYIIQQIQKNIPSMSKTFRFSDLLVESWNHISYSQRKKMGRLFRKMVEANEFPNVYFLGLNSSGIALYKRDE